MGSADRKAADDVKYATTNIKTNMLRIATLRYGCAGVKDFTNLVLELLRDFFSRILSPNGKRVKEKMVCYLIVSRIKQTVTGVRGAGYLPMKVL